jgi:hypothetical protein
MDGGFVDIDDVGGECRQVGNFWEMSKYFFL